MFWLKKAVSFWLMPVPLCGALLVAGLAVRGRAGRALVILATVLLLALSNRFVSSRLLGPLEERFPAVPEIAAAPPPELAGCRLVVVLGSGHGEKPGLPATSELSLSGLGRLVEAIRLLDALPGATLVLSGPGEPGHPTHASVLAQAARSLGVPAGRIRLIESARDTEDEAHAVAALAAGRRVALVTSAWHMPRAARLFAAAGVDFLACPADYQAKQAGPPHWGDLGIDSESLGHSTLAVHEWLGILWLRLRGVG